MSYSFSGYINNPEKFLWKENNIDNPIKAGLLAPEKEIGIIETNDMCLDLRTDHLGKLIFTAIAKPHVETWDDASHFFYEIAGDIGNVNIISVMYKGQVVACFA